LVRFLQEQPVLKMTMLLMMMMMMVVVVVVVMLEQPRAKR
jgi:hypothetical protein